MSSSEIERLLQLSDAGILSKLLQVKSKEISLAHGIHRA